MYKVPEVPIIDCQKSWRQLLAIDAFVPFFPFVEYAQPTVPNLAPECNGGKGKERWMALGGLRATKMLNGKGEMEQMKPER